MISGSTYTHSALSALGDWTLGTLPIFLVWDLNMNPRTKISVAVILALGALLVYHASSRTSVLVIDFDQRFNRDNRSHPLHLPTH